MTIKGLTIFISSAHADGRFVTRLRADLQAKGYNVLTVGWAIRVGDNLIDKIAKQVKKSQYVIVVLSRASTRSIWVQLLSVLAMREISGQQLNILPVLVEDCEIPGYLRDRMYADFRGSYEEGLSQLFRAILISRKRGTVVSRRLDFAWNTNEGSAELQLKRLRTAFRDGDLSLFCGAGVSIDAGIPSWIVLLRNLVGDLFRTGIIRADGDDFKKDELAAFYQEYFNPSALMIAQYLKNNLGKDFLDRVRSALYASDLKVCATIDAIAELCRPQRSRQALQSIVTYNFDDLIEQRLSQSSIRHKSIFKEGQRRSMSELPVYHVHGFLPQKGRLTTANEIVFSEDAYHSQFIDPFSWANLVQLHHLNSSTCLFVGISVTDPNLRRLLDVSSRKNPDRRLSHFLFRRRHERAAIAKKMKLKGINDKQGKQADAFAKGAELLEEQDSNNMGLNVIWVDDYSEIPEFLKGLLEEQVEDAN